MKKRLLCTQLPSKEKPSLLNETEAHHAIVVLRLRDGEPIAALDGQGHQATVILRLIEGPPRLEYSEPHMTASTLARLPLTLEMAVIKGNAMEWCIEKAVELGVEKFFPILTDFTVIQIKEKGPGAFRERWQKIADQALKQCGRLYRMEVQLPIQLESHLQNFQEASITRLWCDETSRSAAPYLPHALNFDRPLHLLIGPEGGWSPKEITLLSTHAHTHRTHLGPLILRAETAALFAVSVIASQFFANLVHPQPINSQSP